jgi:hypothetical protein
MTAQRQEKNEWARRERRADQDIGTIPRVKNQIRKTRGKLSLEYFAQSYFPARFWLPLSDVHREAIEELHAVTGAGGQVAVGLPRGFGKTTLAEVEILRAILYGLRRFVVLVAATERHAARSLKRLKAELESNELLAEDFPEACHAIRSLERNPLRAKMQTYRGEATRIEWTADGITLPHIEGKACSGGTIQVAGLTAALRGLQVLGPGGKPIRPDLVLLDDVQTRESAGSPTQTADREAIIADDVLMMAGPTTRIAAVMLCTVIQPGDLSDRHLDPEKHPEWKRVRTRTITAMPANMDAWDAYGERRRLALAEDSEDRVNADYEEHRSELEAGAVVSWPERIKDGDLTALQSAMHAYLDNPRGFWAELQNEPKLPAMAAGVKELSPAEVAKRLSGSERRVVPRECSRVTAGFDCSPSYVHWFAVTAWTESGAGVVVDYGPWPSQVRSHFQAADARPSLAGLFPNHTPPQRVFAGLEAVTGEVLGRAYQREGGGELRIERALVDAGDETGAVYQFVRQSPFAAILYPSKGFGRTTTSAGVGSWKMRPGERAGPHWRLTAGGQDDPNRAGRTRAVQFDSDAWKSILHGLLTTPLGGTALTLWGRKGVDHEMFAEHLGAEWSEPATIKGMTFDKWSVKVHRPDNHLWDALIMSAVAASVAGLKWQSNAAAPPVAGAPPKRKLSDIRRQKEGLSIGR